MSMPEQLNEDDLIAALVGKQLDDVTRNTKRKFAKKIMSNLPKHTQSGEQVSVIKEYSKNIANAAEKASEALKHYYALRDGFAENAIIASVQGLMANKNMDKATLSEVIKHLDFITQYSGYHKPGTNNSQAVLLARMIAENYKIILGVKPSHHHSFQTNGYKDADWILAGNEPITPYDRVCLIVSRVTGIQFSEYLLRKNITLVNQSVKAKRGKLTHKKTMPKPPLLSA